MTTHAHARTCALLCGLARLLSCSPECALSWACACACACAHVRLQAIHLEERYAKLSGFIRTEAEPQLVYLPVKHNSATTKVRARRAPSACRALAI